MPNRSALISIVVPTRERSEYLGSCLETIIRLDDPNIEIVVSDNHSQDDTATLLKSISDRRLRVVNPGRRLGMTDNFQYALEHSRGDYVVFLGDDDGILASGWTVLRSVVEKERPQILKWPPLIYNWPSNTYTGTGGELLIRPRHTAGGLKRYKTRPIFERFCSGTIKRYRDGANIYHGCVARSVIDAVQMRAGRYFYANAPDVGAAIANLLTVSELTILGFPVSIGGTSPRSTGAATHRYSNTLENTESAFNQWGQEELVESNMPRMSRSIRSVGAHTLDSLFMTCDYFTEDASRIDLARWYRRIAAEFAAMPAAMRLPQIEDFKTWCIARGLPAPDFEPSVSSQGKRGKAELSDKPVDHRITFDGVRLGTRRGFGENILQAAILFDGLLDGTIDPQQQSALRRLKNWGRTVLKGRQIASQWR